MGKKMLNVAYLNGAEGLVRKAASSGGSGGGEASTIEYLDVSGMDYYQKFLICACSCFIKGNFNSNNNLVIVPPVFVVTDSTMDNPMDNISFVAIDLNAVLVMDGRIEIINDYIVANGVDTDAIPRITKEEFYSLE